MMTPDFFSKRPNMALTGLFFDGGEMKTFP